MQSDGLIHGFLERAAGSWPEKTALVHGELRLSYGELLLRAERVCQWLLQHDVHKGDRVALLTDQPADYIAAYFGVLAAGGIVVGLNTQTSKRSLTSVLSDCGATVILSQQRFAKYQAVFDELPLLHHVVLDTAALWQDEQRKESRPGPVIMPEDIGQIIYTSGTTGSPKGVMLRHQNLVANTRSTISYLGLTQRDTIMAILPFFYSYGNSVLLSHIAVGGTLVVNQSFLYPKVILDQMVEEQVTGLSGVPSTFAILLNRSPVREYTFPSLRYLTQAGAAMAPSLAQRLSEVFPGVAIYIMYGQTEAAPRLSYLEPKRLVDKAGSIGKAIPGVVLEVCRPDGSPVPVGEVGEIVASGDNIMAGYWRQPDETAKVLRDDKLWTGDLARIDEDGFLYIEGRKSAMIKSGSHRIAPKEIEEVIMEYAGIHEVAVVGVPDEILGEKIVAFVVLKEQVQISGKELIQYCHRQLPAFKIPQHVIFLDELPKTDTGKVKTTLLHL
ncbi:class I adenylate-forming enzyme family protein [Desulfofustis glycolicus]|uniref:Acyl-CoA synthetase (AMP-forming)/AMP-acid ligase II n=1 Tax=Desulfofustis glycolicus DSM 9705 TaxID=1121409 RepID=A0A1M5WAG2_9BACT|nr:AMP-binding protein [Desulfofustis glycolicus]SHH84203.1 Acyl-CoA synthetase (AMP-forming)/AMP-acid ligase II [Desulfofustis glycolicus DSM 9705]